MSNYPSRPVRVATAIAAKVRDSDGGITEAIVTNVSASGCALEGDGGLEPGEHIDLFMDNRPPCGAEVRWSRGRAAGAKFDEGVGEL